MRIIENAAKAERPRKFELDWDYEKLRRGR